MSQLVAVMALGNLCAAERNTLVFLTLWCLEQIGSSSMGQQSSSNLQFVTAHLAGAGTHYIDFGGAGRAK